jgi:thioesterase domain-containing protein/aryl carrier-like protein
MIGRPVANTQCYILDEHHQPVPIGATGELYIAGDGLARGYLNRPDLTAEKFLPNPFSTEPGARMYRTGDLARFLADGTIECLGRTDHQVKIRGFRIELGEIESALRTHPDVRQAVVIAREDTPGEKHLVGYVVPEHESPNVSALRSHLKLTLPSYMIPSAIMILETIPLTANGKIDRRSLPSPMSDAALQKAEIVAPRTHVEKQLSEIWEELFETTAIGVHDDFFDLGGHSILAVKMMTRIKRVFGKSLTINALFEAPTIARLASRIGDAGVKLGRHSLVAIQVAGSKPPIYWIPGGAGLGLFRLTHIVTRLGSEQPVYGLGSNYPESLADIETVEQRSLKYIELVRSVQPHGPYCFAGFCAGGIVAYEMAQQLTAAGEPVAFVGMINCALPNFPSRAIDRALFKAQRLRYQVAAARADGVGLAGYIRQKFSDRREARERHRELAVVAAQVRQSGFQQDVIIHNDALLDATGDVFSRYQPRRYPGAISLFYSNDSAFMGLSPRMDPRFRWTDLVMRSEIRSFEADHDNIFGADESGPFAEALKSALDTALGGVGG